MQIGVESDRAVQNKRIFVLDSDEITRTALQLMLHDENEAHAVASVAAAYEKAAERKPDAILLGLGIVREQGVSVCTELARRIPGVRILIVAESLVDPAVRSCLERGAHSTLGKPLRIEAVRRKVDILLGRRTPLSVPVQRA